jgi:cytochrome c oxidase cbb3-type subunit 3
MKYFMLAFVITLGLAVSQLNNAVTAQGGGAPKGGDAQNAAPQEGGDVAPEPTPEAKADAATPAIEGANPPDNTPVMGACSGSTVSYIGHSGPQDAMAAAQAQEQATPAGCPTTEAPAGAAPAAGTDPHAAPATAPEGEEAAAEPAEGEEAAAEPAEGEAAAAEPAQGEEAAGGGDAAAGDPALVEAGQALFTGQLGCYGCHGREGGGGMGPALNDKAWIYGGDQAAVTESVANGRPNGMPAFGGQATPEQIQQVVAFVLSLSK